MTTGFVKSEIKRRRTKTTMLLGFPQTMLEDSDTAKDMIMSPNQNGMRSGVKNKSAFPFSDKLGELSDKIGSTIDDTISKFRRKDREDSPERCRY